VNGLHWTEDDLDKYQTPTGTYWLVGSYLHHWRPNRGAHQRTWRTVASKHDEVTCGIETRRDRQLLKITAVSARCWTLPARVSMVPVCWRLSAITVPTPGATIILVGVLLRASEDSCLLSARSYMMIAHARHRFRDCRGVHQNWLVISFVANHYRCAQMAKILLKTRIAYHLRF
jgi:hypothetical protein